MIFVEWFVIFILRFREGNFQKIVPIAYYGNAAPVFGTVMFNYAMVVTVPSWCNEKTHGTNINRALGYSIASGTLLFIVVGFGGALAYQINPDGNLLSAIDSDPQAGIVSTISVFLFPISVVATSIPIYSIIVRYNLLENKICSKPMANFIGVILPWLVTIPFYTGQGLQNVINWSSLISGGIINFIIPFWIYVRARDYKMASLSEFDRADLDEQLDSQFRDPDQHHCFGKCHMRGEDPAPTHYAFPCLSDHSKAPSIIAYTFMAGLSISVLGVIIINILGDVGIY